MGIPLTREEKRETEVPKWQKKTAGVIASDQTFITFNALVVGKVYEIDLNYRVRMHNGDTGVTIDIKNGATLIRSLGWEDGTVTGAPQIQAESSYSTKFTATDTVLTIEGSSLSVNSDIRESEAVLTETEEIETTDFT